MKYTCKGVSLIVIYKELLAELSELSLVYQLASWKINPNDPYSKAACYMHMNIVIGYPVRIHTSRLSLIKPGTWEHKTWWSRVTTTSKCILTTFFYYSLHSSISICISSHLYLYIYLSVCHHLLSSIYTYWQSSLCTVVWDCKNDFENWTWRKSNFNNKKSHVSWWSV